MRPGLLLPPVLLLALLAGCGTEPAPAAAPAPSVTPTPSPTPVPVVFEREAVRGALVTPAEAPPGYSLVGPDFGGLPERESLALCVGPEGTRAPAVPPAPAVLLQGAAGFDSLTQAVAVLPDEATAIAVLAAVQRHAATCEPTTRQEFSFQSQTTVQESTRAAVVPLTVGAWKGVRQSSTSTYTGRKVQRWTTQSVVLRRGNAVLDLEVSGETAPPDLAAVLTKALARLDATLPAQTG